MTVRAVGGKIKIVPTKLIGGEKSGEINMHSIYYKTCGQQLE